MRNIKVIIFGLIFMLLIVHGAEAKLSKSELEEKLSNIQEVLSTKQDEYDALQEKIDIYEENLKSKQQQETTLNSQMEVIDQDIERTEAEIDQTQIEIASLELNIESLSLQIDVTEDDISDKQSQMGKLVRELYDYDQQTYLEIALTNATLSEFSTRVEYTATVNKELNTLVKTLKDLRTQLKEDQRNVSAKKDAEEEKEVELQTRQESLVGEMDFKENLLIEVQEDEEKFQKLVEEIQAEQAQYNGEMSRLEKSARQTLDQLNASKGEGKKKGEITLPSDFDPIWPVSGTVTTTFYDPDYIFRRYFEHDAIDIAAPQGTSLKAADSGVVAVVRYDGTASYAYVMIVHANNFATVYGHVSDVYVEPDEVVQKGQIIAAVGGLPGTAGAGRFTTGPHVHFGVRLNGIPVDPLLYLP